MDTETEIATVENSSPPVARIISYNIKGMVTRSYRPASLVDVSPILDILTHPDVIAMCEGKLDVTSLARGLGQADRRSFRDDGEFIHVDDKKNYFKKAYRLVKLGVEQGSIVHHGYGRGSLFSAAD